MNESISYVLININQFGCFLKSALRNITDLSKHRRELCLSNIPLNLSQRLRPWCPVLTATIYWYNSMGHSLTHLSRKLWTWSFGCSQLTPGKASHTYFIFYFKQVTHDFPLDFKPVHLLAVREAERICGNQAKAMPNAVWSDLVRVWEMLSLSLLILTPAKQESQFQAYLLLL